MFRSGRARFLPRTAPLIILIGFVHIAAGGTPAPAAEIDLTVDGVPLAATRGEMRNQRLIEVEDTSISLALWEERLAKGAFVAHAGISLDGQSIVRVTRVSYELGLQYARFDPLAEVPEVPAELQAPPDGRLFLVQFVTQPLGIFDRQITDRGGVVRHYLAQYTYLVEADPSAMEDIASLPYVRWVGPYHPAYRVEGFVVQNMDHAQAMFPHQAYNVQVNAVAQKEPLAARIRSIGGQVQKADAGKVLVEAVLTPEQLLEVVGWDEVHFVDRWGPYESDMDIARAIGGADYIELVGDYDGTGVRGEVFDNGFNLNHIDFASRPLIIHGGNVDAEDHGASCSGIVFGDGTGSLSAKGLLPMGQGIVADVDNVVGTSSRYTHSAELVQEPYNAVFQTTSGGGTRTLLYTTVSANHDAILFDFDITFCQSQSNAGDQMSRPEAWAKNIISGGGVFHENTLTRDDDCWCGGASVGPASDGRIKPTFTHFYDHIRTVSCCEPTSYTDFFWGTSGATPIICGHVGLFYQMWADGVFGNPVDPEADVFANRSHMTTAKATLINTAYQYPFSGQSDDLTRVHQGWGMPDLQNLYDLRDRILIIDETDVLAPFETTTYLVSVAEGESVFKVTMTYADPPGSPGSQTQHRINDVDLVVTSPGGDVYYGNHGLLTSPFSSPGGDRDTKNTVENVFVRFPESGTWTVEVQTVELIQDGHVETPDLDVDYALVVSPWWGVIPDAIQSNLNFYFTEPRYSGCAEFDDALFTCSDLVSEPVVGPAFVWLVAAQVDGFPDGIGAEVFGIDYDPGISITGWTLCTGAAENPQNDGNGVWPDPGTGNNVLWSGGCYSPPSEVAKIGFLFVEDGATGSMSFIPDPRTQRLESVNCLGAVYGLEPGDLGTLDYTSGTSPACGPGVAVPAQSPSAGLRLQLSANPIQTESVIRYAVDREGPVRLIVYDARGRQVDTLVDRTHTPGAYTVTWDGRRSDGAPLASSVLFVRLEHAGVTETRKIVIIR